jgi:hypothetical protein
MILITEVFDNLSFRTETQIDEASGVSKKHYFVEGIYAQAESKNKNGRVYPHSVLDEGLVQAWQPMIAKKRGFGELGHPQTPIVQLDKVCHYLTKLEWNGNDVIGKSKVLDTPNGKIVQTLIDEGMEIGMSTRAMGKMHLKEGVNVVQPGLKVTAIDVVADPSAHQAFTTGLMEGKEWVFVNDVWTVQDAETIKNTILETSTQNLSQVQIDAFMNFMNKLNRIV